MTKISTLVLLLSIIVSSPASADKTYTDGNELLCACTELIKVLDSQIELDSFKAGKCWGYISASTHIYQVMNHGPSRVVCLPEGVEVSHILNIVIEYLKEHPKELDHPAFFLISTALSQRFPCPRTQLHPQPSE